MKPPTLDLSRLTAQQLKNHGNKMFSDSQFSDSIKSYSLAISKEPGNSSFYSNRALAYLHLQEYQKALIDCQKALELDPSNLKAYFFAGQCHLSSGCYDLALEHFIHSHERALQQRINFGDDISSAIRLTKKLRFQAQEKTRKEEESAFQARLRVLLERDADEEKRLGKPESEVDERLSGELAQLDSLFDEIDQKRRRREVPEHFLGRISFEVMQDPVITPSGITYDRKSILAHLRKVGHFDPITRQPLHEGQFVPNLALKEIVDAFLDENPWAYDY